MSRSGCLEQPPLASAPRTGCATKGVPIRPEVGDELSAHRYSVQHWRNVHYERGLTDLVQIYLQRIQRDQK